MSLTVSYKTLFGVNLIHLYYLSKGDNSFLEMGTDDQVKQFNLFEINNFISVTPTQNSIKILADYQLIFKPNNTGFNIISRVLSTDKQKPFITLDEDLSLEFLIKITDNAFFNYTDPNIETSTGLYYFSNERLASEAITFPLISLAETFIPIDSDYIITTESTEDELEKLTPNEMQNLFGIISITMRSTEGNLVVTDSLGNIPADHTKFEILFGNRLTFWRYLFSDNQTVEGTDDLETEGSDAKILISKNEYPLTHKGFISVKHHGLELPNPNANMIKPDTIIENKAYSEIYM